MLCTRHQNYLAMIMITCSYIDEELLHKQKLLNYHQMMIYVSNLMCVYFQKWTKLPKYLWNIHQTSTCIYEFSIAVFKTSRLPNPTYHCELIYIKRVTKKQKLQNYLWMMIYVFHFSFFGRFKNWPKLLKYLWNIYQTNMCIYEFSITLLKLTNPTS